MVIVQRRYTSDIMTQPILTGVLFLFVVAVVQAAPNFSGVWNLNVDASEYGPLPKPQKIVMTIEQAEPSIQITQEINGAQGPFTARFKYSTDGKEVSNVNGPSDLKSTAKWDNDTLVIESTGKFRGNDLKLVDKWTLSSDGKTLKLARHISVQQGEVDQTQVWDKK